MKTRLKNRIAGFSREQLIDWICLSCVDIRSTYNEEDAQDMIDDIREAIEIGFPAAVTAQPVKRPNNIGPGYASVALSTRDEQWYDAIGEAGYEVIE